MPTADVLDRSPARSKPKLVKERGSSPRPRADIVINVRAPEQTRELIDSAAAIEGKSRSEFILDSACRRAQEVLLEQRLFALPAEKYEQFLRLLESPPPPNGALKRLLAERAPWEK